MINICRTCGSAIIFDETPHAGWARKSAWGYHFYCKDSSDERHHALTNLDVIEQLAKERNLI